MVRWCCQKPKGRPARGASRPPEPPPPPPAPPPSAGGYAESIVRAGLQGVYDLRLMGGPTAPPTRSLPADAGDLPAGCSLGVEDGPTLFIHHAGAVELNGWSLHGYKILVTGSATVARLTDVDFANDQAVNYNIQVGDDSDTPQLILNRVRLTGDGPHGDAIAVMVRKGASLTATDVNFARSNGNHIKSLGPVSLTRVRFGPFGQGLNLGAHFEAIQAYSGTVLTIEGLVCDMRGLRFHYVDGSPAPGGSAFLFIDAGSFDSNPDFRGDVSATMSRMILTGARDLQMYVSLYAADGATHSTSIAVSDCVFGAGWNGAYSHHDGAAAFLGCLDFDTAENIDTLLLAN